MKRDTTQWSRVIVGAVIMGYDISDTKPGIEPSKFILSLIKKIDNHQSVSYISLVCISFTRLYIYSLVKLSLFCSLSEMHEKVLFKFKLNLFCLKHVSIPANSQWHLGMSTPDSGTSSICNYKVFSGLPCWRINLHIHAIVLYLTIL